MGWQRWMLGGFLLVAVGAACGEKVDCDKLCEREAACAPEISLVTGIATPDQIKRLTDENRKTLADRRRDRCRPECGSPTKPGSVHTKWRRCLELADCDAFARCVYR